MKKWQRTHCLFPPNPPSILFCLSVCLSVSIPSLSLSPLSPLLIAPLYLPPSLDGFLLTLPLFSCRVHRQVRSYICSWFQGRSKE